MTTKKTDANQTTEDAQPTSARPHLPTGTRVLNTEDGEPGCIVNGFARNAAMLREITAKGNQARFKKVDRGQFAFNAGSKA
jgi:hypothetical protein